MLHADNRPGEMPSPENSPSGATTAQSLPPARGADARATRKGQPRRAAPAATDVASPEEPAAEPDKSPAAVASGDAAKSAGKEAKSDKMDWYILKVQSNREESIREGLLRRVAIAGLDFTSTK